MSNEQDNQEEQNKAKRTARAAFIANAVDAANPPASAAPAKVGSAESSTDTNDNSASFSDAGTEYIEGFLREELGLDGDLTDDEFAMAALDFLGPTPAKEGATMFFNPDELNKLAQKESNAVDNVDDFSDIDAFAKSVEELEEAIALVSEADYGDEGTVMIPDLDQPEAADVVAAIAEVEQEAAQTDAVAEVAAAESDDVDQSIAEPLEEMVVALEEDDSMAIDNSDHLTDETPAEELFEEAVSEISQDVTVSTPETEAQSEPEEPVDDAFFELMEIQALLESDSDLREANNQDDQSGVSAIVEEVVAPEPEIEIEAVQEVETPEPVEEQEIADPVVDEAPVAEEIIEEIESTPDVVEVIAEAVIEPEAPEVELPDAVVELEPEVEAPVVELEAPEVELPVAIVEPEPVVEEVEVSAEIEATSLSESDLVDSTIDTTAKVETLNFKVEDSENYLDSIIAALDAEVSEVNLAAGGLDSGRRISLLDDNVDQMMVFTVGSTTYAMPMDNVLEISEPIAESAVPFVPNWVRGVINLRGEIISLVDLRVYLDSDGDISRPAEWMIVAQTQDTSMLVGFIVDDVLGNRQFTQDQVIDISESVELASTKYLKCVYQREDQLVLALEFNDLLRSSDMMQFQPA